VWFVPVAFSFSQLGLIETSEGTAGIQAIAVVFDDEAEAMEFALDHGVDYVVPCNVSRKPTLTRVK
jgi:hypothetical protein